MNRSILVLDACAVVAFVAFAGAGQPAQVAASAYQLSPAVVGAGGMRTHGAGGWTLDGTVGQVDVSVQKGANGIRLDGGFWQAASGIAIRSDTIFANGFELPPDSKESHVQPGSL